MELQSSDSPPRDQGYRGWLSGWLKFERHLPPLMFVRPEHARSRHTRSAVGGSREAAATCTLATLNRLSGFRCKVRGDITSRQRDRFQAGSWTSDGHGI